MLKVSIVDPSEKDAAALSGLISSYFYRNDMAYAECRYTSGSEFIRSIESCDIIFMEMQMDRLNGLETARILRKLGSDAQLIFVSSQAELAICGYEVDALDYILKPVTPNAVQFALSKAVKHLAHRSNITLALKLSTGTAGIPANDIRYVEVFDHNLVFHTVKGDHTVRGRLSDICEKLDKDQFFLCNRSFIVNLWFVTGIYSDHILIEDTRISVSKSHRRELTERFSAFLNKQKGSQPHI